jgi:hypothetical protein
MIAQILIFFFKVAVIIAARFVIKVMIPKWGKDKKISVSTDGLMTVFGVILFAEFLMAKVLDPAGYKAIVPFVEMVLPTLWILWMEIKRNAKLTPEERKELKKKVEFEEHWSEHHPYSPLPKDYQSHIKT